MARFGGLDPDPQLHELSRHEALAVHDVQTGALRYDYGLEFPEARGLAPGLALSYSSLRKVEGSVVGYGWELSGVHSVERVNTRGTEHLYDGTFEVFRTSLGGELTAVGGGRYRHRDDDGSFVELTFDGDVWTARDKFGMTYRFGEGPGARQADGARVFKWMVSSIEDANGNSIRYEYHQGGGQVYPAAITYPNRGGAEGIYRVELGREPRPDVTTMYGTGFPVATADRISSISLFVDGALERRYELAYTPGFQSKRSLLASIVEQGWGADGTLAELPPVLFSYSENEGFEAFEAGRTELWSVPDEVFVGNSPGIQTDPYDNHVLVDVNADGRIDLVHGDYNWPVRSSDDVYVHVNNGAGWDPPNTSWDFPDEVNFRTYRLDDLDGDAFADLVYVPPEGGAAQTYLNNRVDGWEAAPPGAWEWPLSHVLTCRGRCDQQVVDVNGDGFNDVVQLENSPQVYLNNGVDGWAHSPEWSGGVELSYCGGGSNNDEIVVEVNGDGLPDFVSCGQLVVNTGAGFVGDGTDPFRHTVGPGASTADLNHDGLVDLVFHWEGSSRPNYTMIADGALGFVTYDHEESGSEPAGDPVWDTWFAHVGTSVKDDSLVADISGNGLPDIYRMANNGHNSGVWFNDSAGGWLQGSTTRDWNDRGEVSTAKFDETWRTYGQIEAWPYTDMLDLDGDGLVDKLAKRNQHDQPHGVYLNRGPAADLLETIVYPKEGRTTVTYDAVPLVTTMTGSRPDIQQVVASITHDPQGTWHTAPFGEPQTTAYHYDGGRYSFEEGRARRFAGFATVTATDAAGATTTTFFHQGDASDAARGEHEDHRAKIGRAYRTEVRDAAGALHSLTVDRWERADLGDGWSFVKLAATVEYSFDGDATDRDRAESFAYDDQTGNLIRHVEWGEVTAADDGSFVDEGDDLRRHNFRYVTTSGFAGLRRAESTLDGSGALMAFTRHYYDGLPRGSAARGNETRTERWVKGTVFVTERAAYDAAGLPIARRDARGNVTQYAYDAAGLYPATVTNALSQDTRFEYDYSSGQVTMRTDANDATFATSFDGLDRPVAEWAPDPADHSRVVQTKRYSYEDRADQQRLAREFVIHDEAVERMRVTYFDGLGRVIEERVEVERNDHSTTATIYDGRGLAAVETLPYVRPPSGWAPPPTEPGQVTVHTFDPLHRVTSSTTVAGVTTHAYDGWRTTTTDPVGRRVEHELDAFGRLGEVVELDGGARHVTRYAYDALGNLVGVTDAAGNERRFGYDGLGRRTSAEDLHAPGDSSFGTWSYAYDAAGNLVERTDPAGQVVGYAYDALNRVLSEDDVATAAAVVVYAYDACPNGAGRVCRVDTPDVATTYAYDPAGNVVTETSVIDGSEYVTSYQYDRAGSVTQVTHPGGGAVRYHLGDGGLVDRVAYREPEAVSFVDVVTAVDYHTPTRRVASTSFFDGTATSATFDDQELHRLRRIVTTAPPGHAGAESVRVSFGSLASDGHVRRQAPDWDDAHDGATGTAVRNGSGWMRVGSGAGSTGTAVISRGFLAFDTASLPDDAVITGAQLAISVHGVGEGDDDGDDFVTVTGTTQADPVSLALDDYGRNGDRVDRPTEGIDPADRKDITSIAPGSTMVFDLNSDGRSWIDPTGFTLLGLREGHDVLDVPFTGEAATASAIRLATADHPDASLRPALVVTYEPYTPQPETPQDLAYEYDAVGNVTRIADASDTATAGEHAYTYDDLGRLTSASGTGLASGGDYTRTYAYDPLGNLTEHSAVGSYEYAGDAGDSFANPHAATSIGGTALSYDASGNLVGHGEWAFGWDHAGRLVLATDGATTVAYAYDPSGRRILKTVDGVTTAYPTADFNTDGHRDVVRIRHPAGGLLATVETQGGVSTVRAVHTDHLGSTRVVTGAGGVVEELVDYYPFGAQRVDEGSFDEQLKFTGHEHDGSTGLTYAQQRYYDQDVGRFTSQDPLSRELGVDPRTVQVLADPQLANSYSYARNNPLVLVDPDGENPWSVILYGYDIYETYGREVAAYSRVHGYGPDALRAGFYSKEFNATDLGRKAGVSFSLGAVIRNPLVAYLVGRGIDPSLERAFDQVEPGEDPHEPTAPRPQVGHEINLSWSAFKDTLYTGSPFEGLVDGLPPEARAALADLLSAFTPAEEERVNADDSGDDDEDD